VAAGVIVARAVHADLSETGLRFGRGLGAFQRFAGATTELVWNGQAIAFHSQTVPASIDQVIDDFVGACDAGAVSDELATRLGTQHAADRSLIQRLLVLRDRHSDEEGTAVCFAGMAEGGLAGFAERFKRFARNLDLAELGAARYLYARQIANGTQLLLLTADGPLKLARLLPSDGRDAEGFEPIAGARPKSSVRMISAHTPKLPYGLTTYRSTLPPSALVSDYAAQAEKQGYAVVDLDRIAKRNVSEQLSARAEYRVLEHGNGAWIATAIPDGDGSLLSVVQMALPASPLTAAGEKP
jgi:hypothetical protein